MLLALIAEMEERAFRGLLCRLFHRAIGLLSASSDSPRKSCKEMSINSIPYDAKDKAYKFTSSSLHDNKLPDFVVATEETA